MALITAKENESEDTPSNNVVVSEVKTNLNFVCLFEDKTEGVDKKPRFHLNLQSSTTTQELYNSISQQTSFKTGTFLIAYAPRDEDQIIIDENCEDNLYDILQNDVELKRHDFCLLSKDKGGPVTVIVDTLNFSQQCQDEDVESYASSFFKQQESLSAKSTSTYSAPIKYTDGIVDHQARSACGYVGLINQAMTCYLNSLLQTLFMTPEFRNALYRWRYKGDINKASSSIPFQLQKLFLKLESSKKKAVETKDLTKSFGWDTSEAWQQHDVQELCRVMFDALEETLKDTDQFDLINQLYQGELKDYVKCCKCGYESSRKDNFLDISVDVRPFGSNEAYKNLNEALKAFVTPDILQGNNQYFCEKCNSKQDAHKGLKFVRFPYLLTIQFKRFTFDINTAQRIKLHDRLEFPFNLHLHEFLKDDESSSHDENKADSVLTNNADSVLTNNADSVLTNNADSVLTNNADSVLTNNADSVLTNNADSVVTNNADSVVTNNDDSVLTNNADSVLTNHTDSVNSDDKNDICHDEKPELQNLNYVEDDTYELFSILIHSGSALGGHYYAYIKSFESDQWFCFNDQYVTQVSMEDLEKSFGGGDRYRTGFYSSSYSSSTSAYMLMYRKVDTVKNSSFKKKLSKSLMDLCQSIVQDEEDEVMRREREKNMCKIRLFCQHPIILKNTEHKLELHKDVTLREATKTAWKICGLEDVLPVEQCRLIKYDDHNESYEKSYEGEEESSISTILGGARLKYGFDLLLQCRKKDEQFQVYEPGGSTLKIFILTNLIDKETDEFDNPVKLHVPLTCTVEQLKEHLMAEFDIEHDIRMAKYKEYQDFYLLENPTRTLKMEGFYKSGKVFVDASDNVEDVLLPFRSSLFYEKLEVYRNHISITITLHLKEVTLKELTLSVDKRITVDTLKHKIKSHVNIDEHMFRIFRMYSNNQEYECTRLDETLSNYPDEVRIIVKDGRALQQGEHRIKLYLLNTNNTTEHVQFLMDGVVWKDLSIFKLKEDQVFPYLKQRNIYVESLARLRIRKKSFKNPARIFPDVFLFDKDITVNFPNEFFVEILKEEETVVDDDYLSIYVRQWHPSKVTIDPLVEIILYKATTVDNLKTKIGETFDIPVECIDVAKGQGIFPCNISPLEIDSVLHWKSHGVRLGEVPYSIHDDGSVIYFRDNRETLKKLNNEERSKIMDVERQKAPKSTSTYHRKEKALKIYTNASSR